MEIKEYSDRVYKELVGNILDFWLKNTRDEENGGFMGMIDFKGIPNPKAAKGLILNSRILWSFSTVYLNLQDKAYLEMADRAYNYLDKFFFDEKFGGYYWMLDCTGKPIDEQKEIYGQAFTIYALAEYYKVNHKAEVLQKTINLFELLEAKCHDSQGTGYYEEFNRDWTTAKVSRLNGNLADVKKTMNAHLHLLEAYTNFYRIWKDKKLLMRLKELINVFLDHIIDPQNKHFILFLDKNWNPKSDMISFGHDIEGSWLLWEAAEVAEDEELLAKVKKISLEMAAVCLKEGMDTDHGVLYEADPEKIINYDKHWWPQAEAAIGYLNAYQLSGDVNYYNASVNSWLFIENFIVDKQNREWYWRVNREGKPVTLEPKISAWKAPYHNSRACIEIINRLKTLSK
jgi:cellobiose epimerase